MYSNSISWSTYFFLFCCLLLYVVIYLFLFLFCLLNIFLLFLLIKSMVFARSSGVFLFLHVYDVLAARAVSVLPPSLPFLSCAHEGPPGILAWPEAGCPYWQFHDGILPPTNVIQCYFQPGDFSHWFGACWLNGDSLRTRTASLPPACLPTAVS